MGRILILVLALAFFIRTVRNTLSQAYLWQLKEYRLDRLLVHLHTWQGKRLLFGPLSSVKWFLLVFYLWQWPIFWTVIALYCLEAVLNLREWASGIKKPVLTLKVMVVVGLVIIGEIILFFRPPFALTIWVLFLDKMLSPAIGALFLIFSLPTKIQRKRMMEKAREIRKKHPQLTVIGLTGSYGKTSTKEFLAGLLATKFKVLKTSGNDNTDIGVAKTIVENLKDQEVFVCEMAAYKKGEIKTICDFVWPAIGVITAINEQHLDLFGTLENTKKTKYELIEALPKKGLAVFNGDNFPTRQLAKKAALSGLKVILYQCTSTIVQDENWVVAKEIKVQPGKIFFTVQIGSALQKMKANLLGRQNVENLLAAIAVAHYLGMSLEEISRGIQTLESPAMTMRPIRGPRGSLLIDDSYNANPTGVMAALKYMKIYQGKKILVLQPMIELGEAADQVHREVGEMAAKICDKIFLTNKNFNQPFLEGTSSQKARTSVITDPRTSAEEIKGLLDEKSVVVFEGKESARILELLKTP